MAEQNPHDSTPEVRTSNLDGADQETCQRPAAGWEGYSLEILTVLLDS